MPFLNMGNDYGDDFMWEATHKLMRVDNEHIERQNKAHVLIRSTLLALEQLDSGEVVEQLKSELAKFLARPMEKPTTFSKLGF